MTFQTLYPGMVNSPPTILSEGFSIDDDHVHVDELSVVPDAPNEAVIWVPDDDGLTAVTYRYTGKSGSSGAGTLTGLTVIEGTPRDWPAGAKLARNFTCYDYEAFRGNIEMLQDLTTISDTAANLAEIILAENQIGYSIDTCLIKIGDGVTAWSSLPYIGVMFDGGSA